MDLTKILKVGDKIYSTLIGDCVVVNIYKNQRSCIKVRSVEGCDFTFDKEGKYFITTPECLLFPSENNRDWSTITKFKNGDVTGVIEKLVDFKPYDKVLVRDDPGYDQDHWCCDFFSHVDNNDCFVTTGGEWSECIPYNKETRHLVGTNQDCPDKYKIW